MLRLRALTVAKKKNEKKRVTRSEERDSDLTMRSGTSGEACPAGPPHGQAVARIGSHLWLVLSSASETWLISPVQVQIMGSVGWQITLHNGSSATAPPIVRGAQENSCS